MLGASVPLISRKSYLSSKRKSLKTRAIVSPGSARMDHVQSRLLSYSAGYPGLVIEPAVPLSVPPHAPSAEETRKKNHIIYLFIYLILYPHVFVVFPGSIYLGYYFLSTVKFSFSFFFFGLAFLFPMCMKLFQFLHLISTLSDFLSFNNIFHTNVLF